MATLAACIGFGVDWRGEKPRRAPAAAAVRCGRADCAEHRRPGHVRLHADRRIPAGGAAVRVQQCFQEVCHESEIVL